MRQVLAIGAHPDDVEIGCGGTLLQHRDKGDGVFILTLTQGGRGGAAGDRIREAESAARMIKAELEILDFLDTRVGEHPELVQALEKTIARVSPTHIYVHSFSDTHQDHRAVHQAVRVAGRLVPNMACYQSPSTTIAFQPQMFVDIADVMERKLDLIDAHQSQVSHRRNIEADLTVATARYWGRFAGFSLVEPFEVVRQTGFL